LTPTTGSRSPAGDTYIIATLFCAVSALSGSAYLVIKLAVSDLPPEVVACARAALGASVLWPLAYRRGALGGLASRRRQLAILGCLEFAAPFLLLSVGTQWIASSLAGVLMAAGPLFVALFAIRFDISEQVTRTQLLGLLVGLLGVVCLLGITFNGRAIEIAGAAIVIGASCSFALGALYLKRHFVGASALGVVAGAMTCGCAVLALPAALALPDHWPSGPTVLAVGVLGIVHAALNYVLFFALVQRTGAGRASVTSYVAPAVAVLLGTLILNEPAGTGLIAGSVLIVVGSWLSTGGALPARAPAGIARRPE